MDTGTKTPQGARAIDRVLEALSTLAAFLDRTIGEVKTLDSDFENRIRQAVHDTEAALEGVSSQQLEEAVTHTRSKLEEQFKTKFAELSAEWDEERARLHTELTGMTQTKAQWEAERARLNGELERLSRVQAATQAEAEKAIAALKSMTSAKAKQGPSVDTESLSPEIERVEALIKQISAVIDDPAIDLSTVIRKNVERAELESYVKGIRYALNSGTSK